MLRRQRLEAAVALIGCANDGRRDSHTSQDLMRTYAQGAQELIRRLVANAATENGEVGAIGHPRHKASERVCRGLSRSLGAEGFAALLTRAILLAEVAHPLLRDIRVGRGAEPILGGLDDLVARYGGEEVDAAWKACSRQCSHCSAV